jgi:D-lactate dehydrogenase
MKTLVYSTRSYDQAFLEKATNHQHELVFTNEPLNATNALMAKGFNAISLFTSDDASAPVLEILASNGIKGIALRTAGHDHVDVLKAKSLGIRVANVSAYSPNAVAEHAVALLMALNRKIVLGQQLMNQQDYRLEQLVGFDLKGKSVGVIGTGKIGSAFATIMHGFGCDLLGYDITVNTNLVTKTNIRYTSLEEICEQCDVISVHCPLNPGTKFMFNKALFSKMKKGIFFINTARGGVVNTIDLIEAINNETIAAVGLDVYENEKPIFFSNHSDNAITDELFLKLRSYPNVLITGHQSFLTNEALSGIAKTTIENLNAWEKGAASPNEL